MCRQGFIAQYVIVSMSAGQDSGRVKHHSFTGYMTVATVERKPVCTERVAIAVCNIFC